VGALCFQQIGRPIPAIRSLECHLGIIAGISECESELERVIDDALRLEHLTVVADPHDHRAPTV
jgi:hypothetical protein